MGEMVKKKTRVRTKRNFFAKIFEFAPCAFLFLGYILTCRW